ncbi:MAG: dienelactone hydrolase family protein [Hyphomicrobiaceae bacterium]
MHIVVLLIMLVAAGALGVPPAQADEPKTVQIASDARMGPFTALLFRPKGEGPFPAVVALHGCGGLLNRDGEIRRREEDWAERLVGAGYVVLLPDSFTARGMREICSGRDRKIFPADRAEDASAAAQWLAKQPFVDAKRLGLMGWSHGAMTVLWTVRKGFMQGPQFKTAIGLYPGCVEIAKLPDWHPGVPLTLLLGEADDWTRPGPCKDLARREGFRAVVYPDAYHGFDTPDSPVKVRKGIGSLKKGEAHVGTNEAAREAAIAEVRRIFEAQFGVP